MLAICAGCRYNTEQRGGVLGFANFDYSIPLRLIVAVVFGGLVGLERGGSRHEAGLRTHIVLCLGSATVMIVGEELVRQYGGDIMRMGSQVVSGIGFLGAGSIIVHGSRVKGITTAAGLWTTACVGLAIGSGLYLLATMVVLLLLFAMWGLRSLTSKINPKSTKYIVRIGLTDRAAIKDVLYKLMAENVRVSSVVFEGRGDKATAVFEIIPKMETKIDQLTSELLVLEGVNEFTVT